MIILPFLALLDVELDVCAAGWISISFLMPLLDTEVEIWILVDRAARREAKKAGHSLSIASGPARTIAGNKSASCDGPFFNLNLA